MQIRVGALQGIGRYHIGKNERAIRLCVSSKQAIPRLELILRGSARQHKIALQFQRHKLRIQISNEPAPLRCTRLISSAESDGELGQQVDQVFCKNSQIVGTEVHIAAPVLIQNREVVIAGGSTFAQLPPMQVVVHDLNAAYKRRFPFACQRVIVPQPQFVGITLEAVYIYLPVFEIIGCRINDIGHIGKTDEHDAVARAQYG